jgi:molybdopterin synthase sulfur carrier subunit
MSVQLFYFAGLRETLGCGSEELSLPPEVDTVAALRDFLAARGEAWQTLAGMKNLKAAVNQTMAGGEAAIKDGDEVAFFPPVTGG